MPLYDFQKEALTATEGRNRAGYFLDMGLGKTFVGGAKMARLKSRVNLIVCQLSKIKDWCEHMTTVEHIQAYDLRQKKELTCFLELAATKDTIQIVGVINYDLVFRRPELMNLTGFTLLLDESSLIQSRTAKRTKAILKMRPKNVVLLSGTPTSGKYENLWSQLHLLGWDIGHQLYQDNYVNWKKITVRGMPIKIVDRANPYKNVDRLKSKMREHGAYFLKTDEVFELPEQTFIDVVVPVTVDYERFRASKIVTICGMQIVGDTTLTERLYSRMLCGHYNKHKIEAARDILESTSDRVIIFYNFDGELDVLKQLLNNLDRPVSEVNGHVKDLTAHYEHDNAVTLVQYQAGAMGLNLQLANKIIYFTPTEKCELWQQSIKRIHRIGQQWPCFYYKVVCENSVEEKIYTALARGVDFTNYLFLN